jgi:glycosyltransferase involved in cell wall biosynthesis
MKIGFDAKWFFDGPPSGTLVVRNLLSELVKISHNDEIYVILNEKDRYKKLPFDTPYIKSIFVNGSNNLISNVFAIPKALNKYNLDAVVFQNFTPVTGNFEKITYIHDVIFATHPGYFSFLEKIYFYPIKFLNKFAAKIVTISKSEKERIIKTNYGSSNKIEVVYNGIEPKFFIKKDNSKNLEIKKKYNLPENYILYVGRLNSRKNIQNLLKAFALVAEKDKQIMCVLVGKTDWKMFNLEELIVNLNIKDRILKLGYIQNEELPCLYSLAKIFCFPSFAEGFGLPPLEAMAAGTPVVVSDIPVHKEIYSNAASFANPNKPDDIANAILKLLNDDVLYKERHQLGIARAKEFSWQKTVLELQKIIYSIKN